MYLKIKGIHTLNYEFNSHRLRNCNKKKGKIVTKKNTEQGAIILGRFSDIKN